MAVGKALAAIAGGGIFNKGFRNTLFGKKGKMKQESTLTPEQQELMSLITEGLASGEGALGELFGDFDPDSFEKGITKPALKNFQDEILPLIQEKFIGGNQVGGSGMRRGQLKAGSDLQERLAALTYQAQQQQNQNKMAGLQTGLGVRGVENIYRPGTSGILGGFLQGAGQGAGQGIGKYIAG